MKNNISLNQLKELALKYPNDMQLGKQIRQMVWKKSDEWRIEQFNRNRARRLVWELVDVEEVTEQGWNGEL